MRYNGGARRRPSWILQPDPMFDTRNQVAHRRAGGGPFKEGMMKVRKKYDSRAQRLHVWPTSIPVYMGGVRKGPKTADLDEVFGKKKNARER